VSSGSWQNAALVVLLVIAGGASWAFQLREPLVVDTTPLAELPAEVLSWKGRDIPMEGSVEEILRADRHLQRSYYDRAGGLVWLYVGYYGTSRGGRSEHTPWVCYPTAGWEILDEFSRTIAVDAGSEIQEIVVQRGSERRLVHFWYRTSRSPHVVGELAHAWDRFLGRLTLGRADGAFVRLSTPLLGESPDGDRARLLSFGRALDAQLAAHWPTETGQRRAG
jgi:EpsI family protein